MKRIIDFQDAWDVCNTKNDWRLYKKKPIIIKAIQIEIDFEVETLEGVHTGKAGDYLLQGIKGEVYPCRKDIFEASYTDVEDNPLTKDEMECDYQSSKEG